MVNDELIKRIETIKYAFDINKFLSRNATEKTEIAKYYRLNRLAYKLVNSRQGFVHMGISRTEKFIEDDFLEHARIITDYIDTHNARRVLELAAGKAATTNFLAQQHINVSFTGLDLPNGQLDTTAHNHANLRLDEGDYHDLSRYQDNSFDIVYIIEALCHAKNKAQVTNEVSRILKPGGSFIVFDGYSSKSRSDMTELETLASDLTYTSMMVSPKNHYYGDFTKTLTESNLVITREENLSNEVLPSMKRLEDKAKSFLKYPRIARLINAITPNEITGNAIAAYLMPLTVAQGLHQYWLTVATKSNVPTKTNTHL